MIAHAHTVDDPADIGARADVVLGRRCPGLSRHVARRLALAGHLRIDGRSAPPSRRVALGQRLELDLPEAPAAEPAPLHVLAATERVVYVFKPPGLATHRLSPHEPLALADRVAATFPECQVAADDPREAGALHRLDRPTSGVVAFARDRAAWVAGRAAFGAGAAHKRYAARVRPPVSLAPLAPAWPPHAPEPAWLAPSPPIPLGPLAADLARAALELGRAPAVEVGGASGVGELPVRAALLPLHLPAVVVDAPLGHGPSRREVRVRADGQPARSRIQPLAELRDDLLTLVDLCTGRRHQARVHLAWLGLPILGDHLYRGHPAPRLGLHAWSIDLGAAIDGEVEVIAPLPADLLDLAAPP